MSFALSLVIMVVFFYFFRYSRFGLAMRATAYSQQVAQSLGISVKQVFAMAWAISAACSSRVLRSLCQSSVMLRSNVGNPGRPYLSTGGK